MRLAPAVDDDVDCRLGILCGNAEFAGVIVARPGGDDAERYVGLRQHLQGERHDAVAADHHQRVHAALERALDEAAGMLGVGARDGDDVDAALVEACDGPFGGMRRGAVPRGRVGQQRDASLDGHGISLPGLRIPVGSSTALTARSTSTPRSPTSSRIQGRWSAPTAWWCVIVAPHRTIAAEAAVFAFCHCSIGFPRCPATTVKYSEAPVGYTCEMWHSTSAGVPDSASGGRQRLCHGCLQRVEVRPARRRLERFAQCSRRQQGIPKVGRTEAAVLPRQGGRLAEGGAAVGLQHRTGLGVPARGVLRGALEEGDAEAAAGDGLLADVLGGGEVDARLGFVGQPDHGRTRAGLDDGAQSRGAGGEVRKGPRLVPRDLWHRVYP